MERGAARQWAQVVGVALLLLGVIGLPAGDPPLFGILNSDVLTDLGRLFSGALLAYSGFARQDVALARNSAGGLGVIYLLIGGLGFIAPTLFGLIPHGYTLVDDLVHLGLGLGGIAFGFILRPGAPVPAAAQTGPDLP